MSCSIGVFFDPTASGAISGTLTITDNAPGSPQTVALLGTGQDFNFAPASGSPTSATVAAGQTASYALMLTSSGQFNQSVSIACTGAPLYSTCATAPGTATLNPNGPIPVGIAVRTTAGSTAAPLRWLPPRNAPGGLPLLLWIGLFVITAALAAQALLPVQLGKRPAKSVCATVLAVIVLAIVLTPLLSCGGGSTVTYTPGTPSGTYNLTVTATFASGTTQTTHNVQLTLNVE
jgi:hypothetical protein